jgi:hypothetical protein
LKKLEFIENNKELFHMRYKNLILQTLLLAFNRILKFE